MKVFLLFPPKVFNTKELMPPLSLAYLSAVLEENNIEVEVLDALIESCSWRELKKRLLRSKADIVGITSLTESRFESFKSAKIAKESLPDSIVVMGGPHVSLCPHDTLLNIPWVDIVVRGEGDITFLELCTNLERETDLEGVRGISYRNENGEIVHNSPRPPIKDLDTLPFPAFHLFPLERYNFKLDVPGEGELPALNLITSRGCPYECVFCATSKIYGRRWRARTPSNVVEELIFFSEKYDIRAIYFCDDTFTIDKKRVERICDLIIDKSLDLKWVCEIRVDTVDKKILQKMKDAGCYEVFYGVESGSQRILDSIVRKKITIEQVKEVSRWLDDIGILKNPAYIVSFPDETLEEAFRTIELMQEIGGKPSLSILRIYPGTELEKIAYRRGVLPKDFSWSKQFNGENLMPAIHGSTPMYIEKLSWEEIMDLAMFWAQEFKQYPIWKRIPNAIKKIKSWKDLKKLLTILKVYIEYKMKAHELLPIKKGAGCDNN